MLENKSEMLEQNQDVLLDALKLAKVAESERILGEHSLSKELAGQALDLVGMSDETSYVEIIESRILCSTQRRAELEIILDILTAALSFDHPALHDTLERLIQRWGSWCSDYAGLLGIIYDRLIILRIAQIGPDKQEIADRFMLYGEYLSNVGRSLEAQNCFTRAASIRKAGLNKSVSTNLSYAQALTRLGCLLMSVKNYEVAEMQLNTAVNLLNETKSGLRMHALEDLGAVYVETGRREEAEVIFKKALSLEGAAAANQNSVANCMIQLGGIYLHWGRVADAFALFKFSMCFDRDNSWRLPDFNALQTVSDVLEAGNNPYLEIVELLEHHYSASDSRRFGRNSLVRKYSWAIPNEEALATILKYEPVVEIGAGTGYWAALLRKRGANLIAYDSQLAETGRNGYTFKGSSWTEVLAGTESVVAYHPDRSLMLCWPPDKTEMAYQALKMYRGNTLIYIGEEPPGCTADEKFHALVKNEWQLEKCVRLPQWHLLHDCLFVYSRAK